MSCITRFAPSPTGDLHIGSVRTALYCWLFAKKNHGKLILRIEDTDLARSTREFVNVILAGLDWLGITYDDKPIFQSERTVRYLQIVEQLLTNNLAYRCTCSKERLDNLRTSQMQAKQKPKYDGHCREKNIPATTKQPYVIRFKNPLNGTVEFNDLVRGKVAIDNQELDDLILLRSDNTPTYNLTVVVDDVDMGITDIIRGEDHISNTPKQINIMQAIGAKVPRYAHIPMILGKDGGKLSKRHGAASVLEYQKLGILPQALLNYLARLGWSHGDQEIFTTQELIELFDINAVNKSAATFDLDKLLWFNHHYLANSSTQELIIPFKQQLSYLTPNTHTNQISPDTIEAIIELYKPRAKTLQDMARDSSYFFQSDDELAITPELLQTSFAALVANVNQQPNVLLALDKLLDQLTNLTNWHASELKSLIKATVSEFNLKFAEVAIPLRVITTGREQTPSIDRVLEIIGKQLTIDRIKIGIEQLKILTAASK